MPRSRRAVKVYEPAITLCTTIPGIEEVAAAKWGAELGVNMEQFPSVQPLASWAGGCPGNYESAGKRVSGTSRKGNTWLRRSLCQAAWAASHAKNTDLAARLHRLAARKGKKRAIVAVAHTILVLVYHMRKTHQSYRALGADYLDKLRADSLKRSLLKRLQRLGVQVTVHGGDSPAALPGSAAIFEGEPRKAGSRRYLSPGSTYFKVVKLLSIRHFIGREKLRLSIHFIDAHASAR